MHNRVFEHVKFEQYFHVENLIEFNFFQVNFVLHGFGEQNIRLEALLKEMVSQLSCKGAVLAIFYPSLSP